MLVGSWRRANDAVHLAGRALAVLHDRLPNEQGESRDVLTFASRFYRVREPATQSAAMVRHVSDFATYNLHHESELDGVGTLYLIDPSPVRRSVPVESDLGYFLMTLMNSTVGCSMPSRRRYALRMYRHLSATFIESYHCSSAGRPSKVAPSEVVGLLAGYHAALWGWRRFTGGPGLRWVGLNALWWSALTRVGRPSSPWLKSARRPARASTPQLTS